MKVKTLICIKNIALFTQTVWQNDTLNVESIYLCIVERQKVSIKLRITGGGYS